MLNVRGVARRIKGGRGIDVPESSLAHDLGKLLPFRAGDTVSMRRLREAEDQMDRLIAAVQAAEIRSAPSSRAPAPHG